MSWRTGRKVGRTIYLQLDDEPSDDDQLIGVMDTPLLASMAVNAVNSLINDRNQIVADEMWRAAADRGAP